MSKRASLASSMKTLKEDTTPNPEALASSRATASPKEEKPSAPKTPSSGKADRTAGMKKMLIPIDPDVHRGLKKIALDMEGGTLEKVVQAACADYVSRYRAG